MKKRILIIVAALLAMTQSAYAYDFSAVAPSGQTLYYSIIDASSVSVVSEIGDYPYYTDAAKPTGDLVIPSSVTDGSTTYSVTSIGDWAFDYCSGLTSVTIEEGVTSIDGYAFAYCSGLTSVTIPASVTSIGDWAFTYCSVLTSISVESGNTVYDSREGCNAIIETSSNTLIVGCMNTVIPGSVTSIGDYAFSNCSGLTSVTIPNSVTSIGYSAFEGCSGLTSVTIPEGVTSIGYYAFGSCSSLTSISVESGNTVYDSREGCNAIIETATNTLVAGCMNTVIPGSVTSIGSSAFYNCSGLTSVTIPEGVTSIGSSAFAYCSGLTSVTIPEGVTSIGDFAFYNCSGLTSVTIPEGVTSIGYAAFEYCSGLTSIECLAMVPPTIGGSNTFDYVPTDIPVYVPCGKVADYQAAEGWSRFTNIQEVAGCSASGSASVSVYAEGNDIVVEGADGNTVTLYDNGGNTLSTSTAPTGSPLRFESLATGTYYVKIGVLPVRMKVAVGE